MIRISEVEKNERKIKKKTNNLSKTVKLKIPMA
jgi:hypothetical protein